LGGLDMSADYTLAHPKVDLLLAGKLLWRVCVFAALHGPV
jgi:hypothetical protein